MTNNEYLEAILNQESFKKGDAELLKLRAERKKVEEIIQSAFENSNPQIVYGGSKAKHTMVKSSYDLDLPIYFDHDDTECGSTLKEIYENVKEALSDDYYIVPKNASLQLRVRDGDDSTYSHIDVVPGRRVNEDKSNTDVFLYQNEGEKNRLKTNLETHISHILNSGFRPEIKLAKIWKNKNNIDVKTFVLELLIVKVLKGRKDKSLEENMVYLWEQFRDNIDNLAIQDPANSGNDLAPLLEQGKSGLKLSATTALAFADADLWENILGEVKEQDTDKNISGTAVGVAPTLINNPPQQWSKG
jgi:hypothetical protein